jgi:hypothetical protein
VEPSAAGNDFAGALGDAGVGASVVGRKLAGRSITVAEDSPRSTPR